MPAELTIHDSPIESREPTLRDVLYALSALDIRLTARIDLLSDRVDAVETGFLARITSFERKVDSMFRSILDREDNMDARLRVIEQKMGKVETRLEDIQDDLTSALAAVDQDSITLYDHASRLVKLETVILA